MKYKKIIVLLLMASCLFLTGTKKALAADTRDTNADLTILPVAGELKFQSVPEIFEFGAFSMETLRTNAGDVPEITSQTTARDANDDTAGIYGDLMIDDFRPLTSQTTGGFTIQAKFVAANNLTKSLALSLSDGTNDGKGLDNVLLSSNNQDIGYRPASSEEQATLLFNNLSSKLTLQPDQLKSGSHQTLGTITFELLDTPYSTP